MSMIQQAAAWYVACTDRLGSSIFTANVKNPGQEARNLIGVMMIFVFIYGIIFTIAYQEYTKANKHD